MKRINCLITDVLETNGTQGLVVAQGNEPGQNQDDGTRRKWEGRYGDKEGADAMTLRNRRCYYELQCSKYALRWFVV
jgi:hypothetical protein